MHLRPLILILLILPSFTLFGSGNLSQKAKNTILLVKKPTVYSPVFNTNNLHLDQAEDMHPLETTGRILTFVGLPLAIIGGVMVSQSDALYYNCVNGDCEGDPMGGFGIMALVSGIGLSGTGAILWTIGAQK